MPSDPERPDGGWRRARDVQPGGGHQGRLLQDQEQEAAQGGGGRAAGGPQVTRLRHIFLTRPE